MLSSEPAAIESAHRRHSVHESFLLIAVIDVSSYEEGKYVPDIEPFFRWGREEVTTLAGDKSIWMAGGWKNYNSTESQKLCWDGFALVRLILWRLRIELDSRPAEFFQAELRSIATEINAADERRSLKDPETLYSLITRARDLYQIQNAEFIPWSTPNVASS